MVPAELQTYMDSISQLPVEEQREILAELDVHRDAVEREDAQENFLSFVRRMWPQFILGSHHEIMADTFERVAAGKLKRVIVNLAPRHTKSEFCSHLFPAWFFGKNPGKFVIQCSNTADLAVDFGRKVRDTIGEDEYGKIFPGVQVDEKAAAAGKWKTTEKGQYFAIGVNGKITGRGGDLIIIDDPHSEQEARQAEYKPDIFDNVYEWYTSGPRQRIQPDATIFVVMTRWAKRDLTGRLLKAMIEGDEFADEWEVIQLPAIMPDGKPMWPEFWSFSELMSTKSGLSPAKWSAQYQQEPTAEEGALVKRSWWKRWEDKEPPKVEFIIQSWDTAFLKTERADYSACTTWGVFNIEHEVTGKTMPAVILLDAYRGRFEFPDLKENAIASYKQWEPDSFIVESKAAGIPLWQELRRMGIPVTEFTPSRGNDKISRVNAISDLFKSGMIWAPETRWADEVIEEFAEFPAGENDDFVDSGTQALLRYRQGGFIQTLSDEVYDEKLTLPQRKEYY